MNLFELFVKIGVDDQASGNLSKITDKLGNGLKTAAKIGTAAVTAAGAAIVALTKSSIDAYAEYEQLVGGVETLFEDLSWDVQQNAGKAFETAGLSANEYMSTAMSFAASLNQSLLATEGNISRSADLTDQAIIDMADNANKMGTSMEMIQNAYQGFAKQNYTMLDNLKLGYGGTKEEMERLLEDAGKLSGIEYDISSFADIVEAIHVVQTEMGITGTTAKEASETISGSVASMSAAWSNLVTGLADDEADFDFLMDDFVGSVKTAAGNIAPRIGIALNGVAKLIQEIVPVAMEYIPQIITEFLPTIGEAAIGIVTSIGTAIFDNLDQILNIGIDIIEYLKNGIVENMPTIVESATEIVNTLSQKIVELSSVLAEAAFELVDALGNELSNQIPGLSLIFENLETAVVAVTAAMVAYKTASAIAGVIDALRKATEGQTLAQTLLNAVMNANPFVLIATLIAGLVAAIITLWNTNEGFRNAIITAWETIRETATSVFTAVANFFTETIPNAFQSMVDWIREGISSFISIGSEILTGIYNGIVGSVQSLYEAAKTIILTLAENIIGAENLEKIISVGGDLIDSLIEGVENVIDTLTSVGEDVVDSIEQGISDAWEGLKSWFNGLWDSLFGNRKVSVTVEKKTTGSTASNANGISYVPYDGYYSVLHKGERVLTAEENKAYSRGATGNTSGITIIQNIQSVPQTPVEFAAATEAYFEQARWAFA